ncbi:MAG: hypothetical protein RR620_08820 [Clostridium sp.]
MKNIINRLINTTLVFTIAFTLAFTSTTYSAPVDDNHNEFEAVEFFIPSDFKDGEYKARVSSFSGDNKVKSVERNVTVNSPIQIKASMSKYINANEIFDVEVWGNKFVTNIDIIFPFSVIVNGSKFIKGTKVPVDLKKNTDKTSNGVLKFKLTDIAEIENGKTVDVKVIGTSSVDGHTEEVILKTTTALMSIISLSNTYRVDKPGVIVTDEVFGPVIKPLGLRCGYNTSLRIVSNGARLVEAEFFVNDRALNGIKFTSPHKLVSYDGTLTKFEENKLVAGDKDKDNKVTIDLEKINSGNQIVDLTFVLPEGVPVGAIISVKISAYDNSSYLINNVLGKEMFIITSSYKNDTSVNITR